MPWKAGTGTSDFLLTDSNPALVKGGWRLLMPRSQQLLSARSLRAGTNVANPLGLTGTLGVWEVHDQRGVRDELPPCLQKEPFQVWLESIGRAARRFRWALWATDSAADGRKGSPSGLLNQQRYWAPISPWNHECVSSGHCLALVVSCQGPRRANGVWVRDWRETQAVGAVRGLLSSGWLFRAVWKSDVWNWALNARRVSDWLRFLVFHFTLSLS